MSYTVRPGDSHDLPAMVRLLDAAVEWLVARGSEGQWGSVPFSAQSHHGRPPHADRRRRRAQDRVRSIRGPSSAATCSASGPRTPPEIEEPERYIEAMVSSRAHAGRGIGALLVDDAVARARGAGAARRCAPTAGRALRGSSGGTRSSGFAPRRGGGRRRLAGADAAHAARSGPSGDDGGREIGPAPGPRPPARVGAPVRERDEADAALRGRSRRACPSCRSACSRVSLSASPVQCGSRVPRTSRPEPPRAGVPARDAGDRARQLAELRLEHLVDRLGREQRGAARPSPRASRNERKRP